MKFKPIYYKKENPVDKGLSVVNDKGSAGIVTLWTNPDRYKDRLISRYPKLFESDSQLVTLTSLYGNGLPQMLANLSYNPQIARIAITGVDTKVVPISEYLTNFLKGNVDLRDYGGVPMNKIQGSQYYLDSQLNPEMFKYLEVKKFETSDLEGVANYITSSRQRGVSESDRIRIKLAEPEFTDFPSDLSEHNIITRTPLKAWREVLWHLDRFGKSINIKKGVRRGLYNLDVCVTDASFENKSLLKKWGFNINSLKEYQKDILDKVLLDGAGYGYGNRIGDYFGGNALEKVSELLNQDSFSRHAFVSLWDTRRDLLERKSSPCFTDAYFIKDVKDNSLMMTASFRTHNAASAWLINLYGLRAIQEKVASNTGMNPGKINLRSRWIGIDPLDPKIIGTLEKIKAKRNIPIDINDSKGYYIIDTDADKIIVQHFSPDSVRLEEIVGGSAEDIKNKLRQIDGFSSTDHAMWVGMQLANAERKLRK